MVAGLIEPQVWDAAIDDDDDGVCHTMCCADEDVALCGEDVAESEVVDETDTSDDCVVCIDLVHAVDVCAVCPRMRGAV